MSTKRKLYGGINMSCYSIIFSPTGGTGKVADILTNALGGQWQQIDLCRAVAPMTFTAQDICLVAVPSYGGRVPGIAVERLKALSGGSADCALLAGAAAAAGSWLAVRMMLALVRRGGNGISGFSYYNWGLALLCLALFLLV